MFDWDNLSGFLQYTVVVTVFLLLGKQLSPSLMHWNPALKKIVIGLLFGVAGFLSRMIPFQAGASIVFSMENITASLASWIGGPLAGLVTLASILSYQAYLGVMESIAASAMLTAVVIGWVFRYFVNIEWSGQRTSLIDEMTGLPRLETLSLHIQRHINARIPFYLTVLSIDGVKLLNAVNTAKAKNELLKQIGQRLTNWLPSSGSLCQLEGERFLITIAAANAKKLPDLGPEYWQEMQTLLSAPYLVEHKLCHVTIGMGMTIFKGEDLSLDQLIHRCYTALQHAKDHGIHETVQYHEKLTEQIRQRTLIEVYLRTALQENQFTLHYQPQFELQSGNLRGFEALLRWTHPELGPISPDEFIPIAEETRLIIPIGEWVLRQACEMLKRVAPDLPRLSISVNLSGVQLRDDQLADQVSKVLFETELDADRLELELTESTLLSSLDIVERPLKRLQSLGVRLALDDFGAGYSSMNVLRKLPFDLIKIDKSFIHDIGNTIEQEVTGSMIQFIKQLRYGVVAEGLETYEQLVYLKQYHCDYAQGYLFSKPLPEDQLPSLIPTA